VKAESETDSVQNPPNHNFRPGILADDPGHNFRPALFCEHIHSRDDLRWLHGSVYTSYVY
jgi:hypothetical protein